MAEDPGRDSLGECPRGSRTAVLCTLALVGLLGLLSLPLGCGPSIQPIPEGGVRFEHCYRLDLDPRIAPAHRHACWKQWLEVYSYGQSRDRLEYSQRRVRDLEAGDTHPPQLNLDQQEAREARQFYMATPAPATPAPTNVHAPPPAVAPTTATEPLAPGDTCVADCRTARAACLSRCEEPPVDPATAPPPKADAKPAAAPTPAPGEKPATVPGAKPAPPAAPTTEGAEESAGSECDCEEDYKTCGARCFD